MVTFNAEQDPENSEAERLEAEREERARRMRHEVAVLFERDPLGRILAAMLAKTR